MSGKGARNNSIERIKAFVITKHQKLIIRNQFIFTPNKRNREKRLSAPFKVGRANKFMRWLGGNVEIIELFEHVVNSVGFNGTERCEKCL